LLPRPLYINLGLITLREEDMKAYLERINGGQDVDEGDDDFEDPY
jgi:hypothetical protein